MTTTVPAGIGEALPLLPRDAARPIDGICRLAHSDEHRPVNIGNPHEMTISQFGEAILKIVDTPSKMEYHDLPVDDPNG